MPFAGIIQIGAERPIPPRQVNPEIAVGLSENDRVMNPIHVRCHHNLSETLERTYAVHDGGQWPPDLSLIGSSSQHWPVSFSKKGKAGDGYPIKNVGYDGGG